MKVSISINKVYTNIKRSIRFFYYFYMRIVYLHKNSFKLFGLKRKLGVFYPIEGFFELHSQAMEGKKDKNKVQKDNFLAN